MKKKPQICATFCPINLLENVCFLLKISATFHPRDIAFFLVKNNGMKKSHFQLGFVAKGKKGSDRMTENQKTEIKDQNYFIQKTKIKMIKYRTSPAGLGYGVRGPAGLYDCMLVMLGYVSQVRLGQVLVWLTFGQSIVTR